MKPITRSSAAGRTKIRFSFSSSLWLVNPTLFAWWLYRFSFFPFSFLRYGSYLVWRHRRLHKIACFYRSNTSSFLKKEEERERSLEVWAWRGSCFCWGGYILLYSTAPSVGFRLNHDTRKLLKSTTQYSHHLGRKD